MEPTFGFVIQYVRDVEASRRFYEDVVGLKAEREAPTFVQFGQFAIAADEAMGDGREDDLYWLVDDATAAEAELRTKAVVRVPLKQMPFGKVFGVADPNGRTRYLLELAKDRPSRPVSRSRRPE